MMIDKNAKLLLQAKKGVETQELQELREKLETSEKTILDQNRDIKSKTNCTN